MTAVCIGALLSATAHGAASCHFFRRDNRFLGAGMTRLAFSAAQRRRSPAVDAAAHL